MKALWQACSKGPETPETTRALEDALHIYRGDLLTGFDLTDNLLFNEWLQQQRAYLRQVAIEAFYRLAAYRLEHRQLSAAVVVARRLLELEPWHEETHRLLMLALFWPFLTPLRFAPWLTTSHFAPLVAFFGHALRARSSARSAAGRL